MTEEQAGLLLAWVIGLPVGVTLALLGMCLWELWRHGWHNDR